MTVMETIKEKRKKLAKTLHHQPQVKIDQKNHQKRRRKILSFSQLKRLTMKRLTQEKQNTRTKTKTNQMMQQAKLKFVVSTRMEIASMGLKEKNANLHTQKCVENILNMALINKEDAILEKNVKISIPKCASTQYEKENVLLHPAVSLM